MHKRALEQLELEKEDAMQQLRSKVIDISVSLSGNWKIGIFPHIRIADCPMVESWRGQGEQK